MNPAICRRLSERRRQLVEELDRSLESGGSNAAIRDAERTLLSLDRLIKLHTAPSSPAWVAPVFVLGIAMTAIGLAAVVQLRSPRMVLEARATTVTLWISQRGEGLIIQDPAPIESMQIIGDDSSRDKFAGAASISQLKVIPGTAVAFSQDGNCFDAQVLASSAGDRGLSLVAALGTAQSGRLPQVADAVLRAGTGARICPRSGSHLALLGLIDRIDVSRRHERAEKRGAIRTASIREGTLQIPVVGRQIALKDNDQLLFEDISHGTMLLKFDPGMRIAFAGNVGSATHAGLMRDAHDQGASLAPTLLDWARTSAVTGVVSMLTGLIGMIWSTAKYFGYRSS